MPFDLAPTADLPALSAAVLAAYRSADPVLLAAGDNLAAAIERFGGITQTFEALPQELRSSETLEARERLAGVLATIAAMPAALEAERQALGLLGTRHATLGSRIDRLDRTIRAISFLAVNMRITTADMGADGGHFDVFAAEIVRLVGNAASSIRSYAAEQASLAQVIAAAAGQHAAFGREHLPALRAVAEQLSDSLGLLDGRRERSAAAAAEIGARSGQIAAEIATVVMALQVGDATRQRLEHVATALDTLSAGGAEAPWSVGLGDDDSRALAGAVLGLQSDQVRGAADDFAAEAARVAGALTRLSGEAEALVRSARETYGAGEVGGGSFLTELENQLRRTSALMRGAQAARGEVDRAITTIAGALDALKQRLRAVRDVEIDMRLVSLNTSFKCGRLGARAQKLKVIAEELRRYANQTIDDVNEVGRAIAEVMAAAGALSRPEAGAGSGEDEIGRADAAVATSIAAFRSGADRMEAALDELFRAGETAAAQLGGAARSMTAGNALAAALDGSRRRLDELAGACPAAADPVAIAERLRAFGTVDYTMAAERDIHRAFERRLAPGLAAAPVQADAAPAAADIDDLLF
ncbi:MAG: hypothetical protein AB7K86_00440 [Rhodospirillales bacterium]